MIGAVIAIAGIAVAYRIWVLRPGTAAALQKRFAAIHTFLSNKWYFDELIDLLIVRPALWFGRFAESVLERDLRRRHDHRRDARGRPRRLGGGAPPADGLPALLRGGDRGRPVRHRPLLPDLEHVMITLRFPICINVK